MNECGCAECHNDDAPEVHEICPCEGCHDAECHEDAAAWADDCWLCEEGLGG